MSELCRLIKENKALRTENAALRYTVQYYKSRTENSNNEAMLKKQERMIAILSEALAMMVSAQDVNE